MEIRRGYKCLMCGCEISITETHLTETDIAEYRVETQMKHEGEMLESCVVLMRALIEEEKAMLNRVMERASQNLHG